MKNVICRCVSEGKEDAFKMMEITQFSYDNMSHILKIYPKEEDTVYVTDLSSQKMLEYIENFVRRDTVVLEETFMTEEEAKNKKVAEELKSGSQTESMMEFLRECGLE